MLYVANNVLNSLAPLHLSPSCRPRESPHVLNIRHVSFLSVHSPNGGMLARAFPIFLSLFLPVRAVLLLLYLDLWMLGGLALWWYQGCRRSRSPACWALERRLGLAQPPPTFVWKSHGSECGRQQLSSVPFQERGHNQPLLSNLEGASCHYLARSPFSRFGPRYPRALLPSCSDCCWTQDPVLRPQLTHHVGVPFHF